MKIGLYKIEVCLLFAIIALQFFAAGCGKKAPQSSSPQESKTDNTPKVADRQLESFQGQLLDTAIEIAGNISAAKPYIKDRCRTQKNVVDICLKLDQPVRSVKYANMIQDWRKGLCYANIAYYLADNGFKYDQIEGGLDFAEKISAMDHGKKWRNDRIKARIAQVYLLLGMPDKVAHFTTDLTSSENRFTTVKPLTDQIDDETFNKRIKVLDEAVSFQEFEVIINALWAYTNLYNIVYDNPERRTLVEEKIKTSWEKVPFNIRFDLVMQLADYSLSHSDKDKALALADELQDMIDNYRWFPEEQVKLYASLAGLHLRAGDKGNARLSVDKGIALFQARKSEIKNTDRASTLCPIAEVYQLIGESEIALSLYNQAVEESMDNPNPSPRSEDLSAICCSMALTAAEPDDEFFQRIRQIGIELDRQWEQVAQIFE